MYANNFFSKSQKIKSLYGIEVKRSFTYKMLYFLNKLSKKIYNYGELGKKYADQVSKERQNDLHRNFTRVKITYVQEF